MSKQQPKPAASDLFNRSDSNRPPKDLMGRDSSQYKEAEDLLKPASSQTSAGTSGKQSSGSGVSFLKGNREPDSKLQRPVKKFADNVKSAASESAKAARSTNEVLQAGAEKLVGGRKKKGLRGALEHKLKLLAAKGGIAASIAGLGMYIISNVAAVAVSIVVAIITGSTVINILMGSWGTIPVVMIGTDCVPYPSTRSRTLKEGDPGPWTQEGTAAYNRAQWLFDWYIDRGFNGWGAAGAVGNVAIESSGTFHPAMAESQTHQMQGRMEEMFPGARHIFGDTELDFETNHSTPGSQAAGHWFHLDPEIQRGIANFAGGFGPYQWTPGQLLYESDGINGYTYVNPWSDLGDSWMHMSVSQFKEVLYDTSRVEEGLLVHQEFLWLAYSGAGMSGATGLQMKLKNDSEAFRRVVEPNGEEDGAYNFFYYVENALQLPSFYANAMGKERVEATKKAYELFGGDKYPNGDRTRVMADWSAEVTPRNPSNNTRGLPYCKREDPPPSSILEIAQSLVGWWHYRQCPTGTKAGGMGGCNGNLPHLTDGRNSPYYQSPGDENSSNREEPNPDDGTDCSGFVSMVLYWAGTEEIVEMMGDGILPGGTGSNLHTVDTLRDRARDGHPEYEIVDASETQPGDLILNPSDVVGDLAHAAILVESWKGPQTPIIQMGGNMNTVNQNPASSGGFNNSGIVFVRVTPSGDSKFPEGIEPREVDASQMRTTFNGN